MGKYMRKTKASGDVAVMEVTQSSLGVRTRAKTLALQRLQNSASDVPEVVEGSGSYLQLRNRRLQKPRAARDSSKRQKQAAAATAEASAENSVRQNPKPTSRLRAEVGEAAEEKNGEDGDDSNGDVGIEASFGENVLEVEGRERGTRESTPCNLIRDPDIIRTPGSSTRSSGLADANRRVLNSMPRDIPSANELDELFTSAEKEEQKSFIEKYNFDPVSDKPLPGRFEWEKLDP